MRSCSFFGIRRGESSRVHFLVVRVVLSSSSSEGSVLSEENSLSFFLVALSSNSTAFAECDATHTYQYRCTTVYNAISSIKFNYLMVESAEEGVSDSTAVDYEIEEVYDNVAINHNATGNSLEEVNDGVEATETGCSDNDSFTTNTEVYENLETSHGVKSNTAVQTQNEAAVETPLAQATESGSDSDDSFISNTEVYENLEIPHVVKSGQISTVVGTLSQDEATVQTPLEEETESDEFDDDDDDRFTSEIYENFGP